MPVNSFDDYPMSWKPEKEQLTSPKYRALADLLADDILSGKLPPHTKLPPQRELADYLDLNLSTITRAFQLCTQKGLLYGITGRGTFVSPNAAIDIAIADEKEEASYIEMGIIKPLDAFNTETYAVMEQVLQRGSTSLLVRAFFHGCFSIQHCHHCRRPKRPCHTAFDIIPPWR